MSFNMLHNTSSHPQSIPVSSEMATSRSPNRHNRLFMTAEPLAEDVQAAIEAAGGSHGLTETLGWSPADAKRVWCFGPEDAGPSLLVDRTANVANVREVQDSVKA